VAKILDVELAKSACTTIFPASGTLTRDTFSSIITRNTLLERFHFTVLRVHFVVGA
jgi:hypothetical protein